MFTSSQSVLALTFDHLLRPIDIIMKICWLI